MCLSGTTYLLVMNVANARRYAMKTYTKCIPLMILIVLQLGLCTGRAGPQDFWYTEDQWYPENSTNDWDPMYEVRLIEIGESNTVYIVGGDYQNQYTVSRYATDGRFLQGVTDHRFYDVRDLVIGPSNQLYTFKRVASNTHEVYVLSPDLQFLRTITISDTT